jgi:predicted GIY-YIG superfamily endonuclease
MPAMNIYSIYKAVNKQNGKVYIGFDSSWPRRKWEHKSSYTKKQNKFYNALKKYGFDNFDWQVIYQSKDQEHTLKYMEPYFINLYESKVSGYNSTFGGEGVFGLIPNKKQLNSVSKPIIIDGIKYKSRTEAMNELGVSYKKLLRMEKNLDLGSGGQRDSTCHPIKINGVLYSSKAEAKRQLKIGNKTLSAYLH